MVWQESPRSLWLCRIHSFMRRFAALMDWFMVPQGLARPSHFLHGMSYTEHHGKATHCLWFMEGHAHCPMVHGMVSIRALSPNSHTRAESSASLCFASHTPTVPFCNVVIALRKEGNVTFPYHVISHRCTFLRKRTRRGTLRAGRAGYGHWDFGSRDFERK
jgi:hypothetical protein